MKHYSKVFGCLITMLCLSSVIEALPEDRDKPIRGKADSNQLNANTGVTVLTGNVVITQGMLEIYADKVTLEVDPVTNQLTYLIAEGAPATFFDQPSLEQSIVEVSGSNIEVYPLQNQVITTGEAQLTQDGNTASGEKIEYNTLSGLMTIISRRSLLGDPDEEQAELIIQPGTLE